MTITPNQDFFNNKGERNVPDKSEWSKRQIENAQKAEHEQIKQKTKELVPDTSRKHSSAKKPVKKAEQKVSKAELEKYPEYYALSEYNRSVLSATNYWRVINEQPIIPVPESDTNYYKYFDARCYDIVAERKRRASRTIFDDFKDLGTERAQEEKSAVDKIDEPVKQSAAINPAQKDPSIPTKPAKKPTAKKIQKPDNNQPSLF